MKFRLALGLRWKLNLLFGAILVVTMSAFVGLDLYHERRSLMLERAHHLETLARHLAWAIRHVEIQNRVELLTNYERALNQTNREHYRALILDAQSRVVAATDPLLLGMPLKDESAWTDYAAFPSEPPAQIFVRDTSEMIVTFPALVSGTVESERSQLLTILIASPLTDIGTTVRASLITHSFHLLVTALAMMLAINAVLSRSVLRPIERLLASMKQMERGDWKGDLPIKTEDEIGQLTKAYNRLGRNLERAIGRLMRAERLASLGLVAVYLNRELKRPIERIRASAKYLCQHNAFDQASAQAVGCIFDQTERMFAISEKFNRTSPPCSKTTACSPATPVTPTMTITPPYRPIMCNMFDRDDRETYPHSSSP